MLFQVDLMLLVLLSIDLPLSTVNVVSYVVFSTVLCQSVFMLLTFLLTLISLIITVTIDYALACSLPFSLVDQLFNTYLITVAMIKVLLVTLHLPKGITGIVAFTY